jgi:hypothetical protein
MEAICDSETSVDFQWTAPRYILENITLFKILKFAGLKIFDHVDIIGAWEINKRKYHNVKQKWCRSPFFKLKFSLVAFTFTNMFCGHVT